MSAWVGILKKDFKLTRTVFLIGLFMNFLMFMLAMYVGMKADDTFMKFIPMVVAIVFHVLYFPIMLFINLKTEGNQLHLWLHNPQPARTLLLSKILNGVIMMASSLFVLYIISGIMIMPHSSLVEPYWTDTWLAGILIFVHIIM